MPWYSNGETYELEIAFDEGEEYAYESTYSSSNLFQPLYGVPIFIHSPDEFLAQSVDRQFHQKDTSGNYLEIKPEITLIADELKSWSVKARNCLLPGEKKLKFFRIYTKANCEQECLSKATYEACGCVPFYLIRKLNK